MTTPDDDQQWSDEEIERLRNQLPAYVPPLPGIDPYISQAPDAFEEHHAARFGMRWRAAIVAGTAAAMIAAATSLLGLGESPANHNKVTTFYNQNVARIGDGPWCDMGITWEAWHSANVAAVCGAAKGFAYTPAHAAWFRSVGRWHAGLHGIQPGDVVFFNWYGRKSIGDIEHVGLVEHVYADGTIATIECNIGDKCRREHRDSTYVVGYGRPDYKAQQQEDTLKTVVDLGAEKPQTIKAGKRGSLSYELEYTGGDPGKIHTDKDKDGTRYPSIFPDGGDAPYAVTAEVVLAGRPDPGVQLVVAQYKRKTNERERDVRGEELASARHTLHSNVRMSDAHKYRIDLVNDSGHDVVVERAYLLITH